MFLWVISFLLVVNISLAESGKLIKLKPSDIKNELVHSEVAPTSVTLPDTTQLMLAKGTKVKVTKTLTFITGILLVKAKKDQEIIADGITFTTKGAEFEISTEGENIDLAVTKGEVEASSPYVHTFVPEIIKAKEGFRFNKKQRSFSRRNYLIKFKDAPAFDN